MINKWEQYNESIDTMLGTSGRDISADMTECEADQAITEGISVGTEAKYLAKDIIESIKAFNTKAGQKGYDNIEYLSEAIGEGFFKKVINILVKFWQTVVNYVRALLSKMTSSSDISKRTKALMALTDILKANKYKDDAKVSFKKYRLNEGAALTGNLLDPKLYTDTKLNNEGDKDVTLRTITKEAAGLATSMSDMMKAGEAESGTTSTSTTKLDELVKNLESISKDLGFGDKAAAKMLYKLLEKKGISAFEKLLEDVKAKDASNLTVLLKDLLTKVLDNTAVALESKGDTAIHDEIENIITACNNITKGGAKHAKNSMNQNLALEDKFEEGRKQAQDILDALKDAANKIDAYGKSAKGNIETYTKEKKTGNKIVDANDSVIEKHAASASKLSTILIEIQAGMQECLTKGMDTGLTLMKAMLSELEYRAKSIDKLEVEKRETAKV